MKIKVEISKQEKMVLLAILVCIIILLYFINKRYFYILDAIFEEDKPKSIVLKTGFIFPVKTLIPMQDGWEKKIKLYGNKISVSKSGDNFIVKINGKEISTIYNDSYYTSKMTFPTGRVYIK